MATKQEAARSPTPRQAFARLGMRLVDSRNQLFGAQRFPKVVLLSVVIIGFIITLFNERFLWYDNMTNMARAAALFGIAAVAQSIVLIGGGFDLSIGAMAAASGLIMAELLNGGVPTALVILLTLISGCLLGLVNGLIVGVIRINPIIATLGTSSVFYGAVLLYTKGIPVEYPREALAFARTKAFDLSFSFLVYVGIMLLAGLLLHKTVFGWRLYTVGSNRTAARVAGIRVQGIEATSYVLSGLLGACAGVLLAVELGSAQPTGGQGWLLISIAAPIIGGVSVLGGAGTIFGGFLGIVLITEIGNGLVLAGFSSYARELALGIAILIAMITQADTLKALLERMRRETLRRTRGSEGSEP